MKRSYDYGGYDRGSDRDSDRYGGNKYRRTEGGPSYASNGQGSYGRNENGYSNGGNFGGGQKFDGATMGANLKSINWNLNELPLFEKNFYIEHPNVRARTEEESDAWRRSNNITVIGRGIPKVCWRFLS